MEIPAEEEEKETDNNDGGDDPFDNEGCLYFRLATAQETDVGDENRLHCNTTSFHCRRHRHNRLVSLSTWRRPFCLCRIFQPVEATMIAAVGKSVKLEAGESNAWCRTGLQVTECLLNAAKCNERSRCCSAQRQRDSVDG